MYGHSIGTRAEEQESSLQVRREMMNNVPERSIREIVWMRDAAKDGMDGRECDSEPDSWVVGRIWRLVLGHVFEIFHVPFLDSANKQFHLFRSEQLRSRGRVGQNEHARGMVDGTWRISFPRSKRKPSMNASS